MTNTVKLVWNGCDSYEEFKKEYTTAFKNMMSYSPDQAGAYYFSTKMADLYDLNPEWADKVEMEFA